MEKFSLTDGERQRKIIYESKLSKYLHDLSRQELLSEYLTNSATPQALSSATELMRQGNVARTIVFIPVHATHETPRIYNSLSQYARQKDCDPFTVILGVNRPKTDPVSYEYAAEIERAKHDFGDSLDVRYYDVTYEKPTIGMIRKDLWDTGVALLYMSGVCSDFRSPIGVNHDIDTDYISSQYIANVQQHYSDQYADFDDVANIYAKATTSVSHTLPLRDFPMTARGIAWADLGSRQLNGVGVYEEGLTIPIAKYVANGGFSAADVTYETRRFSEPGDIPLGIAGTSMRTSPRRYLDRFPTCGYKSLWTNESFGADDACRKLDTKLVDATFEQLEQHIETSLDMTMAQYYYRGKLLYSLLKNPDEKVYADWGTNYNPEDVLRTVLTRQQETAINALERLICSKRLAQQVLDEHDPVVQADEYIDFYQQHISK